MQAKVLLLAFIALFMSGVTEWQTDFPTAQRMAKEKHNLILLNFSGSDWCIPCIRMRREIFDDSLFISTATSSLVLYNADFPRKKKNALRDALKRQNETLAERYNPEGRFPFTVLLDTSGQVVKAWDGYPPEGEVEFSRNVKKIADDYHR